SPGGYLRSLTDRGKDGKFSTWPMIMALLRAKLDGQKASNAAAVPAASTGVSGGNLRASDNLLKSLNKPKAR
ncbi:replication initiation protein RepC, partial [Staphylococcus aureus]|uniref:replication initiation protein RepC n=2 Tax=Bacteria TaxID=2 RepID=UPI0038B36605